MDDPRFPAWSTAYSAGRCLSPHLVSDGYPRYELAYVDARQGRHSRQDRRVTGWCCRHRLSVHGARIESATSLSTDDAAIELEFVLSIPPANQEARIRTRASVRNVSAVPGAEAQAGGFAYGLQFVDLDAGHYTLLQNLTYEALLADRQEIV